MFTTRPSAPETPVIIKVSSHSVLLRWLFNSQYYKQLKQLKTLFQFIDKDSSGSINRQEFIDVLCKQLTQSNRPSNGSILESTNGSIKQEISRDISTQEKESSLKEINDSESVNKQRNDAIVSNTNSVRKSVDSTASTALNLNVNINELKSFLKTIAKLNNIDLDFNSSSSSAVEGINALFDQMEGDDNESISWNEFESFFMSSG